MPKISNRALDYLRRICKTEDFSIRARTSDIRKIVELSKLGYVEVIPISTGGNWVAATSKGIDFIASLGEKS